MNGKLRQYQGLWLQIVSAPDDAPVSVICHRDFVRTLLQAVRKEKAIANMLRRNLEVVAHGRLLYTITEVPGKKDKVRVTFHLTFNGNNI